jgi:hypothetical protein
MKPARLGILLLAIMAAACAPSKEIESPADPPGIDDEDAGPPESDESSGEIEAEVESE